MKQKTRKTPGHEGIACGKLGGVEGVGVGGCTCMCHDVLGESHEDQDCSARDVLIILYVDGALQ